jgi:acyl-CoA synthetase (AMP-forming)/AMP-acid ligase II
LTGRVSEFINRGGEKVAPGEIDDVFMGHPDVAQAVTFAVRDDRLGEDVATAIVPTQAGALTVQQLRRFAATRLTFHKIPRRIYLVPEIPRGRTGKPNRAALRARFEPVDWQPDEQTVPHVRPART